MGKASHTEKPDVSEVGKYPSRPHRNYSHPTEKKAGGVILSQGGGGNKGNNTPFFYI